MTRWVRKLANLLRRRRLDAELDEELRFHLDAQVDDNIAAGLSPAEARRAALRDFGGVEQVKEAHRDARGAPWLESVWRDVRYGARSLLRTRGATAVALVTLALGIGANTAVFSVVNGVILRPLPFPDADRLAWVTEFFPRFQGRMVPGNDFLDWREQSHTFENLAAWSKLNVNLVHGQEVGQVFVVRVSSGFFRMLRIQPLAGRLFRDEEDTPESRVVILSQSTWKGRFGGDGSIVGRQILLNEEPHTVIGIVPDSAGQIEQGDLWAPLGLRRAGPGGSMELVRVAGRLARGASVERARAEIDAIAQRTHKAWSDKAPEARAEVTPLHEKIVGSVRLSLAVLWAAVILVLLVACFNVASLLLARGADRERDIAVRLAIGGGRKRVVRELLTESLLLGLAGGAAGFAAAWAGVRSFTALLPAGFPRAGDIAIDAPVLAFTFLLMLSSGLAFGLAPALAVTRSSLSAALKAGARTASRSAGGLRAQRWLVVSQITLAVVVSVTAGLLIRSFVRLQAVDPGFRPQGVLSFWVDLPGARYPDRATQSAFFEQLVEQIRTLPGVENAGLTAAVPLGRFSGNLSLFTLEGEPPWPPDEAPGRRVAVAVVGPGAFRTLGIALRRGRAFESGPPPAQSIVINETLARAAFHGQDPIGKRLKFGIPEGMDPWETVIGVVADVKQAGLASDAQPTAYLDYREGSPGTSMAVVARGNFEPAQMMAAVRAKVRSMDPYQPVGDVAMMSERVAKDSAAQRFRAVFLGVAALLALGLAAAGVYGLLSYLVASRTPEFGVRIALGAQRSDILRLVVGQAIVLGAVGIVAGIAGALALTRFLEGLLFEIERYDPLSFVVVAAVLAVVVLAAGALPGWRAATVDLRKALGAE